MNILIIGCETMGAHLSNHLARLGHDVAVVDRNEENFDRLDDDFSGYTVEGVPIDQEVLKRAGIAGCDVLVAASPDDNTNVMVSQLAKEIFEVPRVITHIYDPQRREAFSSHFGLLTVCPTSLATEAISAMLFEGEKSRQLTLGADTIGFETMPIPKKNVGDSPLDIPLPEGMEPFALLHWDGTLDLALTPRVRAVSGDRLIVSRIVD